jgi:hypothetical protein
MADKEPTKQPTQGMDPADGHKGDYDGTSIPKDTRGAGDGGPTGPKHEGEFHGGQSGAAYHGHGQLGEKEVEGEDNENGVSRDP